MDKTRIMFSIDDFKTRLWGLELKKYGCEVVPSGIRLYSQLQVILFDVFQGKRVHAFIFRYLNDRKSLSRSVKFFLRDFLIILLCKLLSVKILWIMHNIDEETHQYYPFLSRLRRKLVYSASKKVLVTDLHLIDVANRYGIKKNKLDWICFGAPVKGKPGAKNIELEKQINDFRKSLCKRGFSEVYLGLCVSDAAKKKTHFLYADAIVGKSNKDENTCVALVIIGNYPEGREFERARENALDSPYILLIDETFQVNEDFIAEQVDFIYRSMTDQSTPYTIYVAAGIEKPLITHNTGALPLIVEKESIGFVIPNYEENIPDFIIRSAGSWDSCHAKHFLGKRSWKIGSEKLMNAIHNNNHAN